MDSGQGTELVPTDNPHEDAGYSLIAEQVRARFGLDLAAYRYEQLHRRLLGFARRRNLETLSEYAKLLTDDVHELDAFLHRFAINVSEFFRDVERFKTLEEEILPTLLANRRRLRAWSAGCSGGHEPYSLAMLLAEAPGDVTHHILATDIDTVALDLARCAGPYPEKEIRNVSEERRARFLRCDSDGRWWGTEKLRSLVTFQRHDLLQDPIPYGFDLILCRNVLIYFTASARGQTFSRLAAALRPGGVLFLGATENLESSLRVGLRPVSFGFYVREGEESYA